MRSFFLLLSESPIANIDKSFLFSASGTPLLHTRSEHPTAFHYSAPATPSESPKYGGKWMCSAFVFVLLVTQIDFAFRLRSATFPKRRWENCWKIVRPNCTRMAVQKVRASSLVHITMPHSMTNALSLLVALVAAEITLLSNLNSKKNNNLLTRSVIVSPLFSAKNSATHSLLGHKFCISPVIRMEFAKRTKMKTDATVVASHPFLFRMKYFGNTLSTISLICPSVCMRVINMDLLAALVTIMIEIKKVLLLSKL